MTQNHNELRDQGFIFCLYSKQRRAASLCYAGGGQRVKESAQRTMGGETEKQEP